MTTSAVADGVSDATFRALFDAAPVAIMVCDDRGVYVAANRAAGELLGVSPDAIVGRTIADFAARGQELTAVLWQQFLKQGEMSGEFVLRRSDGGACHAHFRARAGFAPGLHLSLLRDVSHSAVSAERSFLEQGVTRLLAQLDCDAALGGVLQLAAGSIGWDVCVLWTCDDSQSELRCEAFWSADPAVHRPLLEATSRARFRLGEHLVGSVWAAAAPRWVESVEMEPSFLRARAAAAAGLCSWLGVPLTALGRTVGVVEFFSRVPRPRDPQIGATIAAGLEPLALFIERRASAAALQNSQQKLEAINVEVEQSRRAEHEARSFARKLAEAADSERRRLAHDLHDSVGQTLAMVKLALERSARSPAADLAEPLELIDGLIHELRTLTFDLHPTMLDDLGLVPTLRHYSERTSERTGLSIHVSEEGEPCPLAAPASKHLYRALKELIANAAKHARATRVEVAVRWHVELLELEVADDGVGFEPQAPGAHPRGLGLVVVRERLAAVGGRVFVTSSPSGTRVLLQAPLPALTQVLQAGEGKS